MNNLQILKHAFFDTLTKIKKYYYIIIALILLQSVFFGVIFSIQTTYWLKIMEGTGKYVQDISSKDLSDEGLAISMASGKQIIDPYKFSEQYKKITNDFFAMIALAFFASIIFMGMIWAITDHMFYKKDTKSFFIYFAKFALYSAAAILFALIFFILISTLLFNKGNPEFPSFALLTIIIVVIAFIISYFILLAISSISNTQTKDIFKKISYLSFNRFLITFTVFLICLSSIIIVSTILVLTAEFNIIVLSIVLLLFVSTFVINRIFFLSAMQKIEEGFTHHLLRR